MKNSLFIFSVFTLIACEKEVPVSSDNTDQDKLQDITFPTANEFLIPEFTTYTYKLNVTATGYTSSEHPKIYQQHEYRLAAGQLVNGRYFYKIMRKSSFDYEVGSHAHDWLQMNGWYRYNFDEKKSEFYNSVDNSSGALLMDFNLNEEESFLVDNCSSIDDLHFVVDSKDQLVLETIKLPILKGKLVYTNTLSPQWSYESIDQVEVTPFNPSPFMLDLPYINLAVYDWSPDSFSEWQGSFCVTTIAFTLTNDITGEVVYQSALKDDI